MIEARVPWTLEGPDDSITFDPNDPGTPWMLTEKPRTAVDDRREVYDYPLDDGSYVGDAYAGSRAWALKGILRASSHAERNTEMQRLSALLNSLRRSDGLLKWQPTGFPAVQSTVRRMGAVDFSGGANMHVPFSFSLIAGDPRVYSQTLHEESAGSLASVIVASNMLSANQSGFEAALSGWTDAGASITRSTTMARTGSASMRMTGTGSGSISAHTATGTSGFAVTPGETYLANAYLKSGSGVSRNTFIEIHWYNSSGTELSSDQGVSTVVTGSWSLVTVTADAPSGAAFASVTVGLSSSTSSAFYYVDDVEFGVWALSSSAVVVNAGDADSRPTILLHGYVDDPTIAQAGVAGYLRFFTSLATGDQLIVDTEAREVYLAPELTADSNRYSTKFAADRLPVINPGTQEFYWGGGSSTDANTEMLVRWRDAWMP